jgi:dTMP kinase
MVVSDRYLFSSLAYQGYGLEQDVELVRRVNLEAVQGLMPDITFYLEIDPAVGLARQQRVRGLDRIEQRQGDFFARVVKGYSQLRLEYDFANIDGTATPEQIHRQVLDKIKDRWKGERG